MAEVANNKEQTDGTQNSANAVTTTSQSPSAMVKSSEASTVHLYNVPAHVTDGYLLDLCSRWGSVASIARQMSKLAKGGLEIVVVYNKPAEAQEALRHLDGGNLFGSSLRAQLRSSLLAQHIDSFSKPLSPQELATQAAGGPRNLYVLNLSLKMTNQELERLFSVFGQVTHVCIMAVLDSVGRRRAFVDMATGESARQALQALSGTFIQGYKLDVSFAIIQRSGGPVTDYPPTLRKRAQQASLHLTKNPQASASAFLRTQLQLQAASGSSPSLSSASSPYTSSPEIMMMQHNMMHQSHQQITASPQLGPNDGAMVPYNPSPQMFPNQMPFLPPPPPMMMMNHDMTPSKQLELYVSNLDPVAILDDEDLADLFKPYGTVLSSHLALDQNGTSLGIGVVKMMNPAEAEFARTHVQGRVMDGRRISVTFSPPAGAPFGMNSSYLPGANYMNQPMNAASSMQSAYINNLNTLVNSYNGSNMPVPVHLQQQMAALAGNMGGLGLCDNPSLSSSGMPFMPAGQHTHFNHSQNYYNQQHQQYFTPYMSTPKRFQHYNNSSAYPINPSHYNPYHHSSSPEDVLDQSTATNATASTHEHNNSGFWTIHSREGSVETSATTVPSTTGSGGSSLDIKIEDDDIVNSTGGLKSRSVSFDPSTLDHDNKKNARLARSIPSSASSSSSAAAAGAKSAPSSPDNKGGPDGRSRSVTSEGLMRNPRSRQASKITLLRSVTEGVMEEPEHPETQQSVGGRSLYNSRGGLTRSQSLGEHQA